MEFVNGKDDIPYIMENKMFESTNQIWKVAASIVSDTNKLSNISKFSSIIKVRLLSTVLVSIP